MERLTRRLVAWLGLEVPPREDPLASPRREIEMECDDDQALVAIRGAVRDVLGAQVVEDDPRSGRIEVRFGLVEQRERLVVTVHPLDGGRSAVRIEVRVPPGMPLPPRSEAVEALADALRRATAR